MSTLITVFDTETDGLNRHTNHVVQLASVSYLAGSPAYAWTFEALANPGRPINPEVSAIHGIYDVDVQDKPPPGEVVQQWWAEITLLARELNADMVLVAHNIGFDVPMTRKYFAHEWPEVPQLCTLKLARTLYPDAPNHKLTTLVRDYHKLDDELHKDAHNAVADVWMAALLLEHYQKVTGKSVLELAEEGKKFQLLRTMPFGKHKGTDFSKLPVSYLRWLTAAMEPGSDIYRTALYYLGNA